MDWPGAGTGRGIGQVRARTEAAARAGEQHRADGALPLDRLRAVAQVAQQAERETVEFRRAVQDHLQHVARLLARQVLELHSAILVYVVGRGYDRMIPPQRRAQPGRRDPKEAS
jgi:hypothetical protein